MQRKGTLAVLLALGASACAAVASATQWSTIGAGPDWVNSTVSNPLAGATVTVTANDIEGATQLRLDVEGIDAAPGTHLGAHLHVSTCGTSASSSGGHYVDPAARGSLRERELWLDLHVNYQGRATATATRSWEIPDRANRSVVIHAAGTEHDTGVAGTRLACTDLDA